MQAIQTRFLAPTNTKGDRIKAWCARGSITVGYDYGIDGEQEKHHSAVKALIAKFCQEDSIDGQDTVSNPWNTAWNGGQLSNGDFCFVSGVR